MQKIEQQKPRHKAQQGVGDRPGRQTDPQDGRELRPDRLRRRQEERREDQVEQPDADIAEAPAQGGELPLPPRPAQLP